MISNTKPIRISLSVVWGGPLRSEIAAHAPRHYSEALTHPINRLEIKNGSSRATSSLETNQRRSLGHFAGSIDWKSVRQLYEPENTEFKALLCICSSQDKGSKTTADVLIRTRSIYQETWSKSLKSLLPFRVQNVLVCTHEITLYASFKHLYPLVHFSYHHTNTLYHTIPDITAIDYPEQTKRFEVVYNSSSPFYNNRIHVKTLVDEITPLPSSTSIYNGLNRMERETWDMLGIHSYNHPDPRRILTDYGFDGSPLCKNSPSSGYTEVRYDDEQKRVINEPLEITQEFRNSDLISPWVTRSNIED